MGMKTISAVITGAFFSSLSFAALVPPSPAVTNTTVTTPPAATAAPKINPAPAKTPEKKKTTVRNSSPSRPRTASTPPTIPARLDRVAGEARNLFEEAKNLLVPDQKYLIQFEDEEGFGRPASKGKEDTTIIFSESDVEKYKRAVEVIASYRNQVKQRCSGVSEGYLVQALDNYSVSLSAFNRRALPLVADISENNALMILLVSRTTLVDAPVLVSRYLQFKKQRFKESINRFVTSDTQLVDSMVKIAKILKTELNDSDWNKSYSVRDNALELISLWPRKPIFEATARLSEVKERACVVEYVPKGQPQDGVEVPAAPAAAE